MDTPSDITVVRRSNRRAERPRARGARIALIAGVAAITAIADAHANTCLVKPWNFVFGKQTSAQMSAASGTICQTYLDAPIARSGGIRSIRITAAPRNGTAFALERGLTYRSNSGYQGRDAFSFAIAGSGKRAQKVATVRMNVAVEAPKGAPLPKSGLIKLNEYTPWLVRNRGPQDAKGVFYFIAGLMPDQPDDDRHHAPQYFLTSLAEAGWDIVYAKYPQKLAYPGHEDAHKRVAAFVSDRIKDLKEQGYRRVILGGQSWGAWTTLVAEQRGDLTADALFLMAPATYGSKTALSGRPNLSFSLNRSEFAVLVKSIAKPTTAVFFSQDEYDPGGRDKILQEELRERGIAHLVVANPPELKGHHAGWLPAFDFRYGACLQAFFTTLASQRCEPPAAGVGDFRAVGRRNQIPGGDARQIVSAEGLIGRSYVVYSVGGAAWRTTYETKQSVVLQTHKGRTEQSYELRQGQHCRENQCRTLIRWDDKHLVAFDPKSGAATSWWVEM